MIRVTAAEGRLLKKNVPYKITEVELDLFDTRKVGNVVYAYPKYYAVGDIPTYNEDNIIIGTERGRLGEVDIDGMNIQYEISAVLNEADGPSEDLAALSLAMHTHIQANLQAYSDAKALGWTITIE